MSDANKLAYHLLRAKYLDLLLDFDDDERNIKNVVFEQFVSCEAITLRDTDWVGADGLYDEIMPITD